MENNLDPNVKAKDTKTAALEQQNQWWTKQFDEKTANSSKVQEVVEDPIPQGPVEVKSDGILFANNLQ